ncbi:MarR family winged helix-turn-helix transcriptional regulator [Beduini massiliensis]|uniref:MarR family winged helix-turn-helix transcriptional regulator n=1 Tax=Beduini massiliensis TaxID=1585974 RepID=UPI00059AA10A|nr:MarR family transcriptional regulator [Beduini massiliensis]
MDREKLLEGMESRKALFGLFFSFDNRLQQAGDQFYEEITCKQFFLLICLSLFKEEAPTINDLSEIMGSSHQNVKQIALKLERNGFIKTMNDPHDKRKLRIVPTKKIQDLGEKYVKQEEAFMEALYAGISDEDIERTFQTMSKIEQNLIKIKGEHQ